MKINANDLKPGNVIERQAGLWQVVKTQHVKPGKGPAYLQLELKHVVDGRKSNERLRTTETMELIRVESRPHRYLYKEGDIFVFMDEATYEQTQLGETLIGERLPLLRDDMQVTLDMHEGKALNIHFPEHLAFAVAETEPTIKGQTATSSYKPALLENGLRVMVPPHIDSGTRVVIHTGSLDYIRRADD